MRILLVILLSLMIVSCSTQTGPVYTSISDPGELDGISKLDMTISRISVHNQAEDKWYMTLSEETTVDLITLKDLDTKYLLSAMDLPQGKYDQAKFEIAKVMATTDEGETQVRMPSGTMLMILDMDNKGGNTLLNFDFLADESITRTDRGLTMMPVIKLEVFEGAQIQKTESTIDVQSSIQEKINRVEMDEAGVLTIEKYEDDSDDNSTDVECQENIDCAEFEACIENECESVECLEDDDCGGACVNYECDGECQTDNDCSDDEICEDDECVSADCRTNSDCEDNEYCEDNECLAYDCTDDDDCASDEYCDDNECIEYECVTDGNCEDDQACIDNECENVECTEDNDCDDDEACIEYECEQVDCTRDNDCDDGEGCYKYECYEECNEDDDCNSDERCLDDLCIEPECIEYDDCDDGYRCDDFECVDADCEEDDDCDSDEICWEFQCIDDPECTENNDCDDGEACYEFYCEDVSVDIDFDEIPSSANGTITISWVVDVDPDVEIEETRLYYGTESSSGSGDPPNDYEDSSDDFNDELSGTFEVEIDVDETIYVRAYAYVAGEHYWSDEEMIEFD